MELPGNKNKQQTSIFIKGALIMEFRRWETSVSFRSQQHRFIYTNRKTLTEKELSGIYRTGHRHSVPLNLNNAV